MNLEEMLRAYPVIVCDEDSNEIEIKLEELIEVDDIIQLIDKYIIGKDVQYVEVFRDITDDVDYRYLVKRPMAEKHKNELRAEQRKLLRGNE